MNEEPLNERQFIVDMQFKPDEAGQKLRPAEIQLLTAYIGDILKEVEIEEQNIIEEERKAAQEITAHKSREGGKPCK